MSRPRRAIMAERRIRRAIVEAERLIAGRPKGAMIQVAEPVQRAKASGGFNSRTVHDTPA